MVATWAGRRAAAHLPHAASRSHACQRWFTLAAGSGRSICSASSSSRRASPLGNTACAAVPSGGSSRGGSRELRCSGSGSSPASSSSAGGGQPAGWGGGGFGNPFGADGPELGTGGAAALPSSRRSVVGPAKGGGSRGACSSSSSSRRSSSISTRSRLGAAWWYKAGQARGERVGYGAAARRHQLGRPCRRGPAAGSCIAYGSRCCHQLACAGSERGGF